MTRPVGVPDDAAPPAPAPVAAARAIDLSIPLKVARDRVTEEFEAAYLTEALKATGGNVSRAAELAGVNRKFIQRAMKSLSLRNAIDEAIDDEPDGH